MAILVTGGAGFIGSHTCVELLEANEDIVVVDNLYNSKEEALNRVKEITGKDFPFYQTDLLDTEGLKKVFKENDIECVIHFAGLKAVGESVQKPLFYYENNIGGTISLCKVMQEFNVKKIVFSSSATVYGIPETVPIKEDFPLSAINPYGATKLYIERILSDIAAADKDWSVVLLRYFNPIGAHKSGRIGENPNGIPNNLMPRIIDVALGKMDSLTVFGNDYPTHDGTGVRDYIHVVDLSIGHLKALDKLRAEKGVFVYNLGTGKGYSVMDIINAFNKASGMELKYHIEPRRPGDAASTYADPEKAFRELGWKAQYGIDEMCEDAWRFAKLNPKGYE